MKAALHAAPTPHPESALNAIARNCTLKEDQARKLERLMDKRVAALALAGHIGERYEATMTGVTPKGTFVRVADPTAEGRLCEGEQARTWATTSP